MDGETTTVSGERSGLAARALIGAGRAVLDLLRAKALWLGLGLLGLWEGLGRTGLIDAFVIPVPSVVFETFVERLLDGSLFVDVGHSVKRVMVGYLLGIAVGLSLGAVLGWIKPLAEAMVPLVETLRPIPPIAWTPIAVLWFGIGDTPAYFICFIGSVFPIFVNTFAGVRGVETTHVNAARVLGATRWMLISRILVPSAMPMIMTGLRVGLGVAWICVVAAELIAARSGLGYMIEWNRQLLRTDVVLVGMISIGLCGLASTSLVYWLERLLLPWRRDTVIHG